MPVNKPGPGRPDHDLPDAPGPDHDLPGRRRPGHPDHELPEPEPKPEPEPRPEPKGMRAAPPTTAVSQLLPSSAAIGDPDFVIRVIGSGFDATSVIVFAGEEEPTTFVSAVELTTLVDMSVWQGPDPAIPVLVRTQIESGPEDSNSIDFAFTAPREVPLDPAHPSHPVPSMDLITPL